ncbi:MAG TPA: hypothetical protein VGX91_09390 [Candidatus Cybelea sp.]|jgi:hypothetical protein|nr:hypothetical protein [Candidatus Cybelea sp.]
MRNFSLILAAVVALAACSAQSSKDASQSGSDQSGAAASTSTSTSDSASRTTASTKSDTGDLPEYPGASTEAAGSGSNMGYSASGKVLATGDSFDKVYTWYQGHMPAGSEKSHTTSPMDTAVFMVGDAGSAQKSVTITTQGGKTMITIANVKS